MTRETSWSAKGWSHVVIIALLIAVCAPLAVAAPSGPVTLQVYPTSAPNVYSTTPGWLGWVPNALYAVERDLATYPTRMVGINYGPDGIKGTADDVRITSGPATQEVDEQGQWDSGLVLPPLYQLAFNIRGTLFPRSPGYTSRTRRG